VNGDGYSDVVVGAYRYDAGATNNGRVWVYHGAAGGLSADSDARVVVVSEETGTSSIADRGRMIRGISPEALPKALHDRLLRRGRKHRRRKMRSSQGPETQDMLAADDERVLRGIPMKTPRSRVSSEEVA